LIIAGNGCSKPEELNNFSDCLNANMFIYLVGGCEIQQVAGSQVK